MNEAKLQFIKRVEEMPDEEFAILQRLFLGNDSATNQIPVVATTTYDAVTQYLKQHGLVANLQGYNYIRVALLTMIEEPKSFDSHISKLYSIVADKLNIHKSRIDRSIRHSIASAANSHPERFQHFGTKTVPTVSEFLYTAVDELNIQKI